MWVRLKTKCTVMHPTSLGCLTSKNVQIYTVIISKSPVLTHTRFKKQPSPCKAHFLRAACVASSASQKDTQWCKHTCKKTPRKAGDYMNIMMMMMMIVKTILGFANSTFGSSQTRRRQVPAAIGAPGPVFGTVLRADCARSFFRPVGQWCKTVFSQVVQRSPNIPPYLGTGKSFDNFDMFWNVLMFWDVSRRFEPMPSTVLLSVSCHLFHDHWLNRHWWPDPWSHSQLPAAFNPNIDSSLRSIIPIVETTKHFYWICYTYLYTYN